MFFQHCSPSHKIMYFLRIKKYINKIFLCKTARKKQIFLLFFYYMFDIIKTEYKKNLQKNIFLKTERLFNFIFRDKDISFFIFSILHYNFFLLFFLFIFAFPNNSLHFKSLILFWSFYFFSQLYFGGSVFIRFEKFISKNNSWQGIYEILPFLKISKTKKNIQKSFFIFSIFIYYSILSKIYFF